MSTRDRDSASLPTGGLADADKSDTSPNVLQPRAIMLSDAETLAPLPRQAARPIASHLVPVAVARGPLPSLAEISVPTPLAQGGEGSLSDAMQPRPKETPRAGEVVAPSIGQLAQELAQAQGEMPSAKSLRQETVPSLRDVAVEAEYAATAKRSGPVQSERAAWLVVLGGDPYPRGHVIPLSFDLQPRFRLGVDPGCDIVLNSQGVSREHAEIGFSASTEKFFISDLDSTNGSFLLPENGGSGWLQVSGVVELSDSCKIRLGRDHVVFTFRCY